MASYNRVILMGHLTRDPELRNLTNTTVCDFSLAVNRQWKDDQGEIREEVLFIDCSAFGRTGQTIGENLTKGRPIHVDGRLKLDQWEQEDGQRRSKIRVVVEQFRFVDAKPGSTRNNGNAQPAGRKPGKRTGNGSGRNTRTTRSAPVEKELVAAEEAPF
jgi:single-strand DNA-binding protein